MKKIHYNKLIRDRIPDKIRKSGGISRIRKLKKKEYERELLTKVGEEASALPKLTKKSELTSELADIIDVIEEIKKFKKIATSDIKRAQAVNLRKKGGFHKRLFLYWTSDTGYKTNERRYSKRRK